MQLNRSNQMKDRVVITSFIILLLFPDVAFGSVESSLLNFVDLFATRILPLFGALGLVCAGFSFIQGNPNAKSHVILAVSGVAVGLMAKMIVELVRQTVK